MRGPLRSGWQPWRTDVFNATSVRGVLANFAATCRGCLIIVLPIICCSGLCLVALVTNVLWTIIEDTHTYTYIVCEQQPRWWLRFHSRNWLYICIWGQIDGCDNDRSPLKQMWNYLELLRYERAVLSQSAAWVSEDSLEKLFISHSINVNKCLIADIAWTSFWFALCLLLYRCMARVRINCLRSWSNRCTQVHRVLQQGSKVRSLHSNNIKLSSQPVNGLPVEPDGYRLAAFAR